MVFTAHTLVLGLERLKIRSHLEGLVGRAMKAVYEWYSSDAAAKNKQNISTSGLCPSGTEEILTLFTRC